MRTKRVPNKMGEKPYKLSFSSVPLTLPRRVGFTKGDVSIPPLEKGERGIFTLIFLLCLLASCENDFLYDPIPPVLVDETINLTNQEYLPLRQDGGFVEIVGGWKGILIYRENSTTYRAFEKASPHRFEEACAEIFVDPSGFFIKEGCDNTIYDFQGNPAGGVSPLPLRQYGTQLDGNFLYIFNLQ